MWLLIKYCVEVVDILVANTIAVEIYQKYMNRLFYKFTFIIFWWTLSLFYKFYRLRVENETEWIWHCLV